MAKRRPRKKQRHSGGGGGGHGGGGVLQGMRSAFRRAAGADGGGNAQSGDTKSKVWNIVTWVLLAAALGYLVYRYTQ